MDAIAEELAVALRQGGGLLIDIVASWRTQPGQYCGVNSKLD
ncbi:MAG: hypothetical protein OEN20_07665 [Gammaproteobacteria bacterium]|nr:hypothetical protein [Gammaproteobacteria bacterium]